MTSGAPELVLLPGLDGTGRLFERLVKRLEGRLAVRIIGYPSDPALGYPALIDLVCAKIGAHPVILLGESFSGPIAVEATARMPNRVRGLILAATFARSPLAPWLIRMAARIDHRRIPKFFVRAALLNGASEPELAAAVADIMTASPPELIGSRLNAVAGADARAALARVSCPILALHGDRDWIVSKTSIARAIADNARARMKILRGPHMLLQVNVGDAAREIEAFVGGDAPEFAPRVRP